ncbi:MAG: hypothetical protein KBD63_06215 [Bacteriovoracaceae bacterium]|nr:hypothetical protein [Bacteriovoracaceae bacterium]
MLIFTLFILSFKVFATDTNPFPVILNDEDQIISQEYVNDTYLNQKLEEQCQASQFDYQNKKGKEKTADLQEDYCDPANIKVLGKTADKMIDAVASAYSLFVSSSASMSSLKGKGGSSATQTTVTQAGDKASKVKKEMPVACDIIPGAGTIVAKALNEVGNPQGLFAKNSDSPSVMDISPGATQAIEQTEQESTEPSQREAFFMGALTHRSRARSAAVQGSTFAATASCYGIAIAAGAAPDAKTWIKLGASTMLGAFYGSKAITHQKYKKIMEQMGDDFPGKGACNPITEKLCYCNQPEHAQDEKYCQAFITQRENETRPQNCVNNLMQVDARCECLRTNTCMDSSFYHSFNASGFGGIYSGFLKDNGGFLRGQTNTEKGLALLQGNLNGAQRFFEQNKDKIPDEWKKIKLNADQTRVAQALNKMGVPTPVARFFAGTSKPADPALAKQLAGGVNTKILAALSPNQIKESSALNYRSGRGKEKAEKDPMKSYLSSLNKKGGTTVVEPQSDVLIYAEKALSAADISRENGNSLFEIISHRYRNTMR